MTYAPATLTALGAYWTAHGGVNLGIVGDTAHAAKGTSYHLGADQLTATAYSRVTARDKAGLTNAASAIDLGRLGGSLPKLRAFSVVLVARCRTNAPGTSDLREIIWSPDGVKVLRWDRERGYASEPRTGEADDSHIGHTHISAYRDSEHRDKVAIIRPYFEEDTVQAAITDETPCLMDVPLGAPLLELDGKTVLRKMTTALPGRPSPYGVGTLRAMFATTGGVRRTVLVKPTAVRPIPAPDCAPLVAAATEPLELQLHTAQTSLSVANAKLSAANAKLSAIKTAGGF